MSRNDLIMPPKGKPSKWTGSTVQWKKNNGSQEVGSRRWDLKDIFIWLFLYEETYLRKRFHSVSNYDLFSSYK